ncbi:MAG: nucleotide sugar dehydrogenase, partial [Acholeplasmataceae bacterium]|nr:nucleotide sugar dehydrogenase [Acholeplasmataceae bacterium]
ILREKGAEVEYYDPFIPKLPATRKYQYDMSSIQLTPDKVKQYDVVIVITDHTDVDYQLVRQHAKLIVDTRNVFKLYGPLKQGNVVKA